MLISSEEIARWQKSIEDQIKKSETKSLSDKKKKQSDELNASFKLRKGRDHSKIWKSIQTFHSDQGEFKQKEFELHVINKVKNEMFKVEKKDKLEKKDEEKIGQIIQKALELDKPFSVINPSDEEQYLDTGAEHTEHGNHPGHVQLSWSACRGYEV